MKAELAELAGVLEESIAAAEELCRNLAAQKKAIIAWDVTGLISKIDAREPRLRALARLEQKQKRIVESISGADGNVTLSRLLELCPTDEPHRVRLQFLRDHARQTFSRLQADERSLYSLMENLLLHIQTALSPFTRAEVPLYGDTGAAEVQRPSSAFVHGKV